MSGEGGREKEIEGREWWDKEARETREAERSASEWVRGKEMEGGEGERETGHNQFIMSSPVNIDLRIKLLRDLPELQSDQCWRNVGPHVTQAHHTGRSKTQDWPLQDHRDPCTKSAKRGREEGGQDALPTLCFISAHTHKYVHARPGSKLTNGGQKTGSAYGRDH